MECKKNIKNLDIQQHEPKTNPPPAPLQFMDDSETNEGSQKCKTEFSEKKFSGSRLYRFLLCCFACIFVFRS